ncbi:hypothetical protein N0M98_04265 [Paenibacillus doosanensis]|uniref:Uncharacterized protein n=1 Tax=Paenibacillus konkukensis TaxID=2020716 RepID=A0ABY4RY33_9BACL|nr:MULTISPECIES: hypothetical protein [Paenibacillus]MCS7459345.1 hypothetical protein [Paenibacillus doosanensis]UQZ87138.1 hypothetical protein SK3146_06434 [Paenibacillus konkukensis]
MNSTKVRFIERDYYRMMMVNNSDHLTDSQIDKILDAADTTWSDLTFKFYDNGSLVIIDNHTELSIPLHSLKGAAYDFYVKQRIRMIRSNLESKNLQSA